MAETVPETPVERAGVTLRLVVVAMGFAVAGCTVAALWVLPERCHWLGWIVAAITVPAGSVVAFLAARGQADDLREFSAGSIAEGFAGEAFGAAFVALLLTLLSCLR